MLLQCYQVGGVIWQQRVARRYRLSFVLDAVFFSRVLVFVPRCNGLVLRCPRVFVTLRPRVSRLSVVVRLYFRRGVFGRCDGRVLPLVGRRGVLYFAWVPIHFLCETLGLSFVVPSVVSHRPNVFRGRGALRHVVRRVSRA